MPPEQLYESIILSATGIIMMNRIISDNTTHRVVTSGIQVLSYLSTPDTRFLVQLRNPTDRLVRSLCDTLG